jgi:hypothetical protein
MIFRPWDGASNVQCVEHKEILINVMDVNFGFVEITCIDIKNVRKVDNGTV